MRRVPRATIRLFAVMLVVGLVVSLVAPPAVPTAAAAPGAGRDQSPDRLDVQAFLNRQPGVLKSYRDGRYRAAQVLEGYATYYNLDPRILLTLLELVPHLLTDPNPAPEMLAQPFGRASPTGFSAQVDWVAREVRAGFGPYTKPPEVRFTDGSTATLALDQDPSVVAVQRFLAQGRTQQEWSDLTNRYVPLFRQFFGTAPETVTPTPEPVAGQPFLKLPWTQVYPDVPGDPLAGQPVRMIHSSYFDHVYPTVDRGSDGNDFIVTYQNRGNLSYNTHDGHDFYFPDRPIGTPIVAAADGIAYAFTTRGNGVVVRHTGAYRGYETVYWHLDAFDQKFEGLIDTGDGIAVQAGDYLGVSGKSGFTDGGAHLHFEVRHNGKQVDPYGWNGPGDDPCAAWVAGCEASVWLWDDSLRGTYDFTSPDVPAAPDTEPPIGTLSVAKNPDLGLLVHFDDHPVQSVGAGTPTMGGAALTYEEGVFDRAVRVGSDAELTYPITGNLALQRGTLSVWANLPETYPENGTNHHYLFAASNNPEDSARDIYTGTLALRHQEDEGAQAWNFWTVDDAGLRHDLVVTTTLQPGWHHFAVAWDSAGGGAAATKQLYIDGVLAASASGLTLPTFAGDRLQIGRWTPGHGESGTALDELAVFQRSLAASEIQSLANRRDVWAGMEGPLGSPAVISDRTVELDTNAIDYQGGIVSVRLRRDGGAWGEPLPYYDSYRWTITGTEGLHTFSVEYRDRADNVSVITTTVGLAAPPSVDVELLNSTDLTATLHLRHTGGSTPREIQLSANPDFAGAEWQPFTDEVTWKWQVDRPDVVYVRFRSLPGLVGPVLHVDPVQLDVFTPMLRGR